VRKKRADEGDVDGGGDNNPDGNAVMQFTVITKRGSKQQVRIFVLGLTILSLPTMEW